MLLRTQLVQQVVWILVGYQHSDKVIVIGALEIGNFECRRTSVGISYSHTVAQKPEPGFLKHTGAKIQQRNGIVLRICHVAQQCLVKDISGQNGDLAGINISAVFHPHGISRQETVAPDLAFDCPAAIVSHSVVIAVFITDIQPEGIEFPLVIAR